MGGLVFGEKLGHMTTKRPAFSGSVVDPNGEAQILSPREPSRGVAASKYPGESCGLQDLPGRRSAGGKASW